jgi:hypothetical protein
MDYQNTRISKLRDYLFGIITTLTNNNEFQINADMLSNDIDNYSLDKIPTASTVRKLIGGTELHRDVYSFRSRVAYSQDVINNLLNVGFFEKFEALINSNNKKKIRPDITGIESISCLNSATMNIADTNTAVFDIQLEITYRVDKEV